MRVEVERITVEATAEELKSSNTLADNLSNILRNAFTPFRYGWSVARAVEDDEEVEEEE